MRAAHRWAGAFAYIDHVSGAELTDLDTNGDAWVTGSLGTLQLPTTSCAGATLHFDAVASENTILGLGHANGDVWQYATCSGGNYWQEIGTKTGFVSVVGDDSATYLAWATDSSGNIWYAN